MVVLFHAQVPGEISTMLDEHAVEYPNAKLHMAEQAARYAVALNADSWAYAIGLARILRQEGKVGESMAILQELEATPQTFPWAGYLMGETLAGEGQWHEAGQKLASVGAAVPLQEFALKCMERGEKEIALDLLESAVRANDTLPGTWRRLGVLRVAVGNDTAGAVNAFQRAIELQPEYVYSYCLLCQTYYQAGEYEKAMETARVLMNRFPQSSCGYTYAVDVFRQWNDLASAEEMLLVGLDAVPKEPGLWARAAEVHYAQAQVSDAMKDWSTAIQLCPDCWQYEKRLGDAYRNLGDSAQALAHYREALRLDPDNARLAELVDKLSSEQQ